MNLGLKLNLCVTFAQTAMTGFQNLTEPTVQLSFNKMLQRLAETYAKNDRMDLYGINPTLSIFLLTPSPVAMQGLDATAL